MTDNEWFLKHKNEIDEIKDLIKNVKDDKKLNKVYKQFLKKENEKDMKINYNTVNLSNRNKYKAIGCSKLLTTSINSNYFIYDKSFNIDKRFS